MHLVQCPATLQALLSDNNLETNNSNRTQQDKKPKLAGGHHQAIYHVQGFELRMTENKSSKWPEWVLNAEPSDYGPDALTTRPKIIGIKTYLFENFSQRKGSRKF